MAFSPGLPECSRPNLPIDRAGPAFRHNEKTGTWQSVQKLAKANKFFLPQRRFSPLWAAWLAPQVARLKRAKPPSAAPGATVKITILTMIGLFDKIPTATYAFTRD